MAIKGGEGYSCIYFRVKEEKYLFFMRFIYQVVSTEKIVSNMSAIVKEVAAVVDQQIPSSTVCKNKP